MGKPAAIEKQAREADDKDLLAATDFGKRSIRLMPADR
jgi:hypothetical protein